jgi:hypothetical protein
MDTELQDQSMYYALNKSTVTCVSIARERVAKHFLVATNTQATIEESPFLCNGNVNTHLQQ